MPLFRNADNRLPALHIRRYTDVRLPQDLRIYVASLIVLLVAGCALGSQFRYAEKISVPGRLSDGTAELYPLRSGTVRELKVAVGEQIVAGDVLAVINSELDHGVDDASRLRRRSLTAEERRQLAALIVAEITGHRAGLAALRRQGGDLRRRAGIFRQQQTLLASENDRLEIHVSRVRSLLAKKMIRVAIVDEALTSRARVQSQVLENRIQLESIEVAARQVQESIAAAARQHQVRLSELVVAILEIDRRLYDLHAVGDQALLASFDGTVSQILVHKNQAVQPSTPLLSLRPTHGELVAELFLSPRAMGVVEVGDIVFLRYAAYPYRQHGLFEARVVELDEAADPASTGTQTVYRARAKLQMTDSHKALLLRDDMTLMADLAGERQRLLHYVVAPMQGVWRRSVL